LRQYERLAALPLDAYEAADRAQVAAEHLPIEE
jgi:hypothetical protein